MADFDPYHEWLGISPEERPINYYSLLSLRCFESNPKVISNAADCKMAYVRTFQTGPYADESQKILNELSKARVTLLNPEQKTGYDAQLRKEQSARTVPLPPPMPPLKRPEPPVFSQPKRPEPAVQSTPKRPEPAVQSTPKRPEPEVQSTPKRPEPEVQSTPKRPDTQVFSFSGQDSPSILLRSETAEKNDQDRSELKDKCRQILQAFDQKSFLASVVERSQAKLEDYQFQKLGLMYIWHQLFPSEEYAKNLQKLQGNIQEVKALYEQCFLGISFDFTPAEREKWDSFKKLIEYQNIDADLSVWKISEERASDVYQAESGKYNVSNFKLKKNLISSADLDVLHSPEPYVFLGSGTDDGVYFYPSFVIIKNQNKREIAPNNELETRVSRVNLVSDHVPQGMKVIDSVWKYATKDGQRDFRYANNEKMYLVEYFKLEIYTKSKRKLAFLFNRGDVADRFAAILKQQVKMTLLPWKNQDALDDLEKRLDLTTARKPQKSSSERGCCGCLLVIIIVVLLYVFMGH